ncbi:MAG: ribonuclease HII [Defluviitaleaceae bacterium]|nr:ribonuclease HII [Defluviitaleaceae bacterium]
MHYYEDEAYSQGYELVAGMDEVGRGPLAGPVLACCVILRKGAPLDGVDDSKKLSPKKREKLAAIIREHALSLGVGLCSHREIDEMGILHATHTAMARAVSQMKLRPEIVLVDGYPVGGAAFAALGVKQRAIVKGDRLSVSIAAASIVAKVVRDRLMCTLAQVYPAYEFETHKGYGTPKHVAAIREHGACDIHRRTFLSNIRPLPKLDDTGFADQFRARLGADDAANPCGSLGVSDDALRETGRKDGVVQFRKRSIRSEQDEGR